jgi:hypothetical protein
MEEIKFEGIPIYSLSIQAFDELTAALPAVLRFRHPALEAENLIFWDRDGYKFIIEASLPT